MEKYQYIDKVINSMDNKTKTKTKHLDESNITFYNISKDTLKILKSFLKKNEKCEIDKSFTNFKNKSYIMQIYLNIALFSFSLRYIEIVTKVKNGGILF